MKISKKVGTGMVAVGVAGICASFGTFLYFGNKVGDIINSSPEHTRVTQVKEESSKLKDCIFVDCAPTNYDCIDEKVRKYVSLQQEQEALMQSENYKLTEKKKMITYTHGAEAILGFIPSFLLVLGGVYVVTRRRDEEEEEDWKKRFAEARIYVLETFVPKILDKSGDKP